MKIAFLTTDNREPFKDHANPQPWFGTAPEALLQGFAQKPEVEVHVVCCLRQPANSPVKLADNIYYHSVVVPKRGWMTTGFHGCIRAVRRKLQEIRPDIVHGQGTEREAAMCAVFGGYPNVLTIHGNMKAIAQLQQARFGTFYWLATKFETLALHRTGGVFCNSAYTENLVAPRTRKTWRVSNPLRLEFFEPIPERTPATVPILLNVGVVDSRKRQLELLASAQKLHRRGARFELQFVGQVGTHTDYGRRFAAEVLKAEQSGYARHIGVLTAGQLIKAMDAADALVHFPCEEAFGLVVAEAMARNLKFFGSGTGGIIDIAAGVEGAEVLPPDDWEGLENAIYKWLQTGSLRPASAALTMKARYHPDVIARKHFDIYREVLQHWRPTAS